MSIMEKIVESFFNLYNDDFFEYFDRYKVLKIMQNKEYKKINQQICSVKEKYPKVISLLEDKESVALNYEEGKAINKILKLQEEDQPTYMAVAFDRREPTFRHETFSQ